MYNDGNPHRSKQVSGIQNSVRERLGKLSLCFMAVSTALLFHGLLVGEGP